MLRVSERRLRLDMDITVTRAADGRRAWTLTYLLGRPLGGITQARGPGGPVAKILGVENYAPSMGALRSDGAISGPSNRFTDLVEGG